MSTADVQTEAQSIVLSDRTPIVNDFSIVAATVNGSGSQTANTVLIRAIFKMGIPVNGKNLFPSNISGLPTWYTIRVSKDGYTARREGTEILIAFNKNTAAADLETLPAGGLCIYPDDFEFDRSRTDVLYSAVPVKRLIKESGADVKLRDYVANMVYVGVLAELVGIELDEIQAALVRHFDGKPKPIALNFGVVQAAAEWTRSTGAVRSPFRVERMDGTAGRIMIEGNTAAALGAIFGGVSVVAWYPITPSTSVVDAINEYLPQLRHDEAGNPTYAVVQAEDELAAIGMVIGAGWAGARAMTATSGPGISLMAEFTGLAYFAEIPAVIWDIQRMGPSTGLPTRVSQGDILSCYFLSHGDTRHVCLLPGSVGECFEFGSTAFDLADRLQTPVFVLSDLDLGMNMWMSEPFVYPEKPLDRGKVLTAEDLRRLGSFQRYADVDGDGIPQRTLPGTDHPAAAFFTRGTGHNDAAVYSERPDDWQRNMARLERKHATARTLVPAPIIDRGKDTSIGIIAFGSTEPAIREARDRLRKQGMETSFLRLRALPFSAEVSDFIVAHERVYVIELNQDGQVCMLLRMEFPGLATRLVSLTQCDGLPLTARLVTERIQEKEQ
ncbi:MAG: 2-oxoacid:acceptor oxidoreductase subunit alpha [Herpetosiphon sp.]